MLLKQQSKLGERQFLGVKIDLFRLVRRGVNHKNAILAEAAFNIPDYLRLIVNVFNQFEDATKSNCEKSEICCICYAKLDRSMT